LKEVKVTFVDTGSTLSEVFVAAPAKPFICKMYVDPVCKMTDDDGDSPPITW
jgi:hypothetical protein